MFVRSRALGKRILHRRTPSDCEVRGATCHPLTPNNKTVATETEAADVSGGGSRETDVRAGASLVGQQAHCARIPALCFWTPRV
jgi:hypothetical protein